VLCFRCGSYNPENAQKCSVCGQGFIDESGRTVGPPRRESKTTQPASIFVPGEMVAGRYRIGELLGQGGVGAVYRARDLEIDVDVAIKGITPNLLQTEEEQKNFSKQIKAARKLQHPNIVRIYDEGHEGNRRFFTMKLLEGLTLRKIIRLRHEKGQPFTAEELVPIFHQLAAALDYAHKSTWHGDLKPENIIILPDLLKITDFNLVKALPLKPFLGIAKSRSKGFPYIAPELRVEAQNIDGRCDTYALGVILGEMLTGMVFEGHYTRAMTAALEQLPTKLDGLIRKAVTEHPDGRYQRGADMAKDLEAALSAMQGPLPAPAKPAGVAPSGAVTAPNPVQKAQPPTQKPPASSPASSASSRPPPLPPPKDEGPDDTGPVAPRMGAMGTAPPPMLSSDDNAESAEDVDDEIPSEMLEIGQSQVLLLQSGVTKQPPDILAEAARRLMAAQSNPEDTLDEGSGKNHGTGESDVDTAPRGAPLPKEIVVEPAKKGLVSSGQRPRDPGALLAELYAEGEDKDELAPPPLPEEPLDPTDRRVELSGDASISDPSESGQESHPESEQESEEGPTDEHPVLQNRDKPIVPDPEKNEIHDALTALKPHPRELMDDDVRAKHDAERHDADKLAAEAEAAGDPHADTRPMKPGNTASERTDKVRERHRRHPSERPPPIEHNEEDGDSLKETLAADVLRAAKERSSPSLHRAEPLPPPIVAPPPVLRPVTPPRRRSSGSGGQGALAAILAVVAVAGAVVVWRFVLHDDKPKDHETDHALVTPGHSPQSGGPDVAPIPVAPAPVNVDAGTVAEVKPNDTTPPKPDETAPKPDATAPVVAAKVDAGIAASPDSAVPVVALASGTCPKGMVFVDGGSFTMGSDAADPMRNFGEANAATTSVQSFCIDYYEQPNGKDSLPTVNVTWAAAKAGCEKLGRRLCAEKEWERACHGPNGNKFPYGNSYDPDLCNTEDGAGKPRALAPAIAFKRCRSGFKVFEMAGNAEEWVADVVNGGHIAKGGAADRPDFSSRCAARRAPDKGNLATVGFRCCADAK
jgi:serine/threonine protein kinase/formylglycine-generating enzyme required for sulfatase activity